MAAPLIVGAARKIGVSTARAVDGEKMARRVNVRMERPELLKKIQRREDRKTKIQNRNVRPLEEDGKQKQYSNTQQNLRRAHALKKALPSGSLTNVNRIKAFSASVPIFSFAIGFWIPQMIFWMVGIFGLGSESIPLFNYVIPGEVIYMLSYVVIVFIGICTMFYAATVYYFRRVRFFSGYKGIIFIFCIVGYFVIFINFFPWFTVWLLAVTYMQDD
jgi:hypothetical protein